MISYNKKTKVKFILFFGAGIIGLISIMLMNKLINWVENEEREKIILWAEAIQRKSHLVDFTSDLFEKLKEDERRKAEIWSSAIQRLSDENSDGDLTFLLKIISSNKNIPSVLTDKRGVIISSINTEKKVEAGVMMSDSLRKSFSNYPPMPVYYENDTISLLYYNDSRLFVELQKILNDYIKTFISEVLSNSASVPVIITDPSKKIVLGVGNIDSAKVFNSQAMQSKIQRLSQTNNFIRISNGNYIFFEESLLIKGMKYYPILFFIMICAYILVLYYAFTSSRRYEQNQVWVGMSKETAHQLGTPISSLMAWVEILRLQNVDESILSEINKDTIRLNTIAERFSKIGSAPKLNEVDLIKTINNSLEYLEKRKPQSIQIIRKFPKYPIITQLNNSLFDWVIENLCKNAIDAIEKNGSIVISITENNRKVFIDISDSGKGIPKRKIKTVFKPGYTTKKRGWGLGLTLTKRIIEEYHNGKIFIKNTEIDKGTTFRISLPLSNKK